MLEAISSNTTARRRATTSSTAHHATEKPEETDEAFRERLPHIRSFARLYALPFVSKEGEGEVCFWKPRATGDWLTDYWIGVSYADAYLQEAALREDDTLLLKIVLDMPREGGAVVAGFLKAVERAAKDGRHVVPQMLFEGDDGCL